MHVLGVFALAIAISATQASAEDFVLSGDQRWLVIATYENPEVAIGYVRGGSHEGRPGKVFKRKDGRFVAVVGPASVSSPEKFLKTEVTDWWPATAKSRLSKGRRILRTTLRL